MESIEEETVVDGAVAAARGPRHRLHYQLVCAAIASNDAMSPQNTPVTSCRARCSGSPRSRRKLRMPGVIGAGYDSVPLQDTPVPSERGCAGVARSFPNQRLLKVPEQMAASGSDLAMHLLANDDKLRRSLSSDCLKILNTEAADGDNKHCLH